MSIRPLTGIRVIEMGQVAAGPFTGMLLADLGADVIKIEKPHHGDSMRDWPPLTENTHREGEAYSENFASLNRNKRSVTIDFKNEDQLSKLKGLIEKADVIIENYRPGVLHKFGLGYNDLKKINSQLVYCSISGYGQKGIYSQRGAFDVTIQAISGIMSVTGEKSGEPVKCGVPIADFVSGLYSAYSILSIILRRANEGGGGYIDCSMLGSMLGISALQTSEYYGTAKAPERLGSAHPRNAPYQAFQGKDKPFIIAAGNDKLWKKVIEIVNLPCLNTDERFITQKLRAKNQVELSVILQDIFIQKNASYWLEQLNKQGVPCAPINDFEEALNDPHVKAMNLIGELSLPNEMKTKYIGYPVSLSDFDFEVYKPPPKLGEHNQEVFQEWEVY